MNIYLFIIVPAMAIMCGLFLWIIVGDARYLWRSIMGVDEYETINSKDYKKAA